MILIKVIFLLSISQALSQSNLLVIPFNKYIKTDNCNLDSLFCQIQNIIIKGDIKIGTQINTIPTFFNLYTELTDISNNKCYIAKKKLEDNTNFFYDYKYSKTFNKITEFNQKYYFFKNASNCKDDFNIPKLIIKENDKIEYDNGNKQEQIFFILTQDTKDNKNIDGTNINCLQIGLGIIKNSTSNELKEYGLINQLKHKEKISNYIFSFLYNKQGKIIHNIDIVINPSGNLLIGDYPHKFLTKSFYDYQLVETYSDKYLGNLDFQFTFDDVYIKTNNSKRINVSPLHSYIEPNNAYIIGSFSYKSIIYKEFFNNFINKKICFSQKLDDEYLNIYCNKDDINFGIEQLKMFPNLYFYHKRLNYTFELTYEDLFIEKNNKFYFLIYFKRDLDESEWFLGIPFLYKYQLTFNLETKKIGFYNFNLKEEKEITNVKPKHLIIIFVFLLIIFLLISFSLGNNIYKYKKTNDIGVEMVDEEFGNNLNNNITNNNKINVNKNSLLFNK